MDGTIIGQGSFIVPATIVNQNIMIPSGVDWMYVRNYTEWGVVGGANAFGIEFYWQRGFPAGNAMVKYYTNGSAVLNGDLILTGGFTLYDPSTNVVGAAVATTASTNATRPVVSTATTTGLAVGSVVRMSNTAQTDVNGVDMVVGAVSAGVSFTLLTATNPLATAPGAIGGAGFYRIINADSLFYPRKRFVVKITQAANAQVSTSVAHGLTPGQEIRFSIPSVSGMIQLNPTPVNNYLSAIVLTVVDDYNVTININTTAFTAFTWPTIAQQPSSFPILVPLGEDTATSLSTAAAQVPSVGGLQINATQSGILADATVNTGFLGMTLGTGANGAISGAAITGPAGSVAADVMYWVAGKSTYGGL